MRPLRGRQGTFDRIIENIRQVAAQGADHDRRQLRRVVGRQLSGAARLPAASRSSRTRSRRSTSSRSSSRRGSRSAEGRHPADRRRRQRQAAERHVHDERGRRVAEGLERLRHLPLRRREDVVPARRRRASAASPRPTASTWARARFTGVTPTPSDPTASLYACPGFTGDKHGVDRAHRRPRRSLAARRGRALRASEPAQGRVRRLLFHSRVRRRLLRGGAHRAW